MKYKQLKNYVIAVDLDGTIVSGFNKYDKKSFKILKKLAKKNIVVIATGRPFRSSKFFYNLLKLKTPLINYNGALIHHPGDHNFVKQMIYIDRQKLISFIQQAKNILVNVFCEIEDDVFLIKNTSEIQSYLHLDGGSLHVGDFTKILPSNPNGAILFSLPGSEEALEKILLMVYGESAKIRHWHTKDCLVSELYNPLCSKGYGLKIICDYYQIPYQQTIAFGDGHNDIEMLTFVKHGIAMENAHSELLKVAQYQTSTVENHGVYSFFKKHTLNL